MLRYVPSIATMVEVFIMNGCCCCCSFSCVRLYATPRRQPTRLPHPWDSPGKNAGMGCHFLLQCMKVKSESEVAQSRPTLSNPMDCSLPGSSVHGIFPGKSTGVRCHCFYNFPFSKHFHILYLRRF